MKKMKKILAVALLAVMMMAIAMPALAASVSWSPYIGDGLIRRGHTGKYVYNLQKMLIELGYNLGAGGADAIFGSATEDAVEAFQRSFLGEDYVDGIVGTQTKTALWNLFGNNWVRDNLTQVW